MRQLKFLLLVTMVAALALSACAPVSTLRGGTVTTASMPSAAPQSDPLADTSWMLVKLDGQAPLPDTTITLSFDAGGNASGSDGCNNYFAPYTVNGDTISFGMGGSTMMACPEPSMAQAGAYQLALSSAATFAVEGDTLTLSNADGAVVAVFVAQSSDLAGSAWNVIGYNNGREAVVSVAIDTELTAMFGADGTISGSAGCNNYNGGYTTDGVSTIAIGPLATTRKMCPVPEGIMQQEAEYLTALETAATYRIDGNRLELRTADGALVANFARLPAETAAKSAAVTGTVTYLVRMALPDDAIVTVSIHNKQLADAPPEMTLLGERTIATAGSQAPIAYAVEYDPAEVQEGSLYSIGARITDGAGKLLFVSTTAIPVITMGNPTENVEIVVDPVQ